MSMILVFARAAVPGQVKTRLIPKLGAAGSVRLHREMVRHTLHEAVAAAPGRVELWIAGIDHGNELTGLAAEAGAAVRRQCGDDLGERMAAALMDAGERDGPVLVIGTDCPWLDAATLSMATAKLASRDAILGPALDGGYVLLGLHRVACSLFEDMPWGTGRVLALTRERLAALGWDWEELEPRSDVDRPADLRRLHELGEPWTSLVGG